MPRLDLNGNPLPDDEGPAIPPPTAPVDPRRPNQPYAPPPSMPYGGQQSPHYPPPGQYNAPLPGAQYGRQSTNAQRPNATKWIAGGICLFTALTVGILLDHPIPVAAPTGFTIYTSANNTFTVKQPIGWNVEVVKHGPGASASQDIAGLADSDDGGGVVFTQHSAQIAIYQGKIESMTGSVTTPLPARQLLKKQQDDELVSQFSGLSDVKDYDFSTEGFGDGASVTWSASGTKSILPSPMYGYYVALSGGNYYVTVLCQCHKSDWYTLKPAFQEVINSLTELAPAGYSAPVSGGEAYPSGPPPHKDPINTTPGL